MKNGGVWRRLAGSLLGTRQIYLCGAVRLTIEEDGKEYVFYIPRFLSLETSKNLDNFFNMYSPSAMSEEYMDALYEDTPCLYVKQDTALELYHLTGKRFYKDFLKKSKNSIFSFT